MYDVSVIVPVYNAEATLNRCIDSLLRQTRPVEIILVNDGSKDKSLEILHTYNDFENIKIISTENMGVAHARNRGLQEASGEYIGFADSDDYVLPEMYETLEHLMGDSDIAICYAYETKTLGYSAEAYSHEEIVKRIVGSFQVGGYPWNKLFRADIIRKNNLSFNTNIHVMEDKLFCLEYMNCVDYSGGVQ